MSRLIDGELLLETLDEARRRFEKLQPGTIDGYAASMVEVARMPTVDPIEAAGIVRCKDCVCSYLDIYGPNREPIHGLSCCRTGGTPVEENGFCAWGVKSRSDN